MTWTDTLDSSDVSIYTRTNGVTKAIYLYDTLVHHQFGRGRSVIVCRDVYRYCLGRGGRPEGILTCTEDKRRTIGDVVVCHISRHVVDASQLVGRVMQSAVLNLDLVARLRCLAQNRCLTTLIGSVTEMLATVSCA